jgi:EcsC protein family
MEFSPKHNSWLVQRAQEALRRGFAQAYETVRVDPTRYLLQLQAAHGLPISTFRGVYSLDPAVLEILAEETIRSGMKMAAAEGAGLGLGGLFTVLPDLSILAAITLRTIQKLSLIYGFEYNTDAEIAELWLATATAAGVDIGREVLEKELVNRFVPRMIRAVAIKASGEVVEKWSGRLIPVASSFIGGGLNYYFVRAWGNRARSHFRARHMLVRQQLALSSASVSS